MKKILSMLLLPVAVMALTSAYSQKKQKPLLKPADQRTLRTTYDSISYALGMDVGYHMANMNKSLAYKLSQEVAAAALVDVMSGREVWTQEESMAFLMEYFKVRRPAELKKASEEVLRDYSRKNRDFHVTDSGLLYKIEEPGDMSVKAVDGNERVVVNYVGTLSDGTEFDGNDDVTLPLDGVISGWSEGVRLIGKGGKIKLVIPPDLGYGDRETGPIPPYAVLVFDIELLDVLPPSEQDDDEDYYGDDEEEYYDDESGEYY